MGTLVVCSGAAREQISRWVEAEGLPCTLAEGGAEARRLLYSREFELAVINAPLEGETLDDGTALARAAARQGVGTVLILQHADAEALGDPLCEEGIAVLERPLARALFRQALRLMNASRRHVESYKSEVFRLQAKLDETKLIDRAKCVLIQYLGMGEKDAHRYIEKQAMDMRLGRREIAENILKTYES